MKKIINEEIVTINGDDWTVSWFQEAGYETVRLLQNESTVETYDCESVLDAKHTYNTMRDVLRHLRQAYPVKKEYLDPDHPSGGPFGKPKK